MRTGTMGMRLLLLELVLSCLHLALGVQTTPNITSSCTAPLPGQTNATLCCPEYPPLDTIALNLTHEFLELAMTGANLSMLVERDVSPELSPGRIQELRRDYERVDAWGDFRDQTMVVKTFEGVCFVAFMGTAGETIGNIQNANPIPRIIGYPSDGCVTRRAWWTTYQPTYRKDLNAAIKSCVRSCPKERCPLVLTGFSKGGAGASVAAVDLADLDPLLITFGASKPLSLLWNCRIRNRFRNWHRFLMSTEDLYDPVPFYWNVFGERQYGWPILLDDIDDNWPLCTPGFNNTKDRRSDPLWEEPLQNTPIPPRTLHEIPFYMERLKAIMDRGCFPVPLAKWPLGHYCHYDDECASDNCYGEVCRSNKHDGGGDPW